MRAVIQTATGKAEEEPIVELSATTTTPPVVVLGADPRRQRSTGHALAPGWLIRNPVTCGDADGLLQSDGHSQSETLIQLCKKPRGLMRITAAVRRTAWPGHTPPVSEPSGSLFSSVRRVLSRDRRAGAAQAILEASHPVACALSGEFRVRRRGDKRARRSGDDIGLRDAPWQTG